MSVEREMKRYCCAWCERDKTLLLKWKGKPICQQCLRGQKLLATLKFGR